MPRRRSPILLQIPRRLVRRRRRRGGLGSFGSAGGLTLRTALPAAGAATLGFIATDFLTERIPLVNQQVGYARIAGKAAVAFLGGTLLHRFSPLMGKALITGGLIRAGVDLFNALRAQQAGAQAQALRGLGNYDSLPAPDDDLEGLGDYEDETNYAIEQTYDS